MSTDAQLIGESPARFAGAILGESRIDVPGALTLIAGADVGINRALAREDINGVAILIAPTEVFVGDQIEVFIRHPDSPILPIIWFTVPADYDGGPLVRRIPANDIPEGFSHWFYRVNGVESGHLKVLVKTELPGGIDPQPEYPGHRLLRPPVIAPSIIDGTQDVIVTVPPWQGMRHNDSVAFQYVDWHITHRVQRSEVGQAVALTISREMIEADGSGQALLQYWITDEVGNMASDHSIGLMVDIQDANHAQRLPAPVVSETDQDNAIYMTALGAKSVSVTIATPAALFAATDVVELDWRGEPRTGLPQPFTESRTVAAQSALTFEVSNAVVQRLAGGFAHVAYTHITASGERRSSRYVQVFIVGNTRRID
ncbi:hypothetical protein BI292_02140 [Pseudomonas sp. 43NM1]|uniref:hypothetical protein n=1 Tax=Pseudomonas sp. 43NM1 TaxID=1904755 RepID=UPI000C348606|nr:hypothetical protein [Pseudomonas sp. 43NM1]PKH28590.1 hypothetical protein BI292_02140 [Pseudomonas sp. 43NM1]